MDRTFLRFAAACALALAVTTFLLWLLPRYSAPGGTFEQALARAADPYYIARLWVSLVHMVLGLVVALGLWRVLSPSSPGFAALGVALYAIWAVVELVAMATNLFGVNMAWRAGYAAADPATKEAYRVLIIGWSGVWDGLYFVLGSGYSLGSLVFGALAIRMTGIARLSGVFLFLAAAIRIAFLLGGYAGQAWAEDAAGFVYPVIQPVGRAVLAVWLWKESSRAI